MQNRAEAWAKTPVLCVSHRRELDFEAVILQRVIISNPEIRMSPTRNYKLLLGVENAKKYSNDVDIV